jgi:NADH-quinone oxidoreductase subunit E
MRIVLSPEEKREIDTALSGSPTVQAVTIDALMTVQRHRGWVSDEAIAELADYLNLSVEELDSIATFFNLIFRRPVGKHVILICDSVSCWLTGYDDVLKHLRQRLNINLGETTADGNFTLLPICCIGVCEHAPALIIDRETYWDLTPEKVDDILDRILRVDS